MNKASMTEEQIKRVKTLTLEEFNARETSNRHGITKNYDIIDQYTESIVNKFASIGKGIKVVVDSGNATGGIVGPKLYRDLGCEVIELFSEPDGNFPNHHPNPSDEKTLDAIKKAVVENNADLGIAFDGDSDRIGVIDSKGNALTGDKLLLIYATDVIEQLSKRGEKPVVVSEVKCSQVLYDTINSCGGCAIMTKTGHGYIKSKMKEENAILAGDTAAAYENLRDMKNRRMDPSLIFGTVFRVFSDLLTVALLREEGLAPAAIRAATGFHEYKVNLYLRSLSRRSVASLEAHLGKCRRLDLASKSGMTDYGALERLIAEASVI